MGLMNRVLGGSRGRSSDDYVEFDDDMLDSAPAGTGQQIHLADIRGQEDLLKIKDTLYDGDIVIADIRHIESNGMTLDTVVAQLNQVVSEIDGDIVQKESSQLILSPGGISISRERL